MKDLSKPEYRLEALPTGNAEGSPNLLAITSKNTVWNINRRDFLQTTVIGLGVLLTGCGGGSGSSNGSDDSTSILTFCAERVSAHVGVDIVEFSPNGAYLASGGRMDQDNQFKLWEIPSGRLLLTYGSEGLSGRVIAVAFNPDSTKAVAMIWQKIVVFDLATLTVINEIDTGSYVDGTYALAFSPDGSTLAVGDENQIITLWDIDNGSIVDSFSAGHFFTSIAYSQDGLLLATASGARADNYPVSIFNMPSGALVTTVVDALDPHIDFVTKASFTPDGQVLVTSSADRSIKLWDVATGALIRTIGISDYTSGYETHYVDTSGDLYAARSINLSSGPRIEILGIPDAILKETIAKLDGNALAVNNDRTLLVVAKTAPRIPDWSVNTIRLWRLDRKEFQNCLFDAKSTRNGNTPATRFEVKYYSAIDINGQEIMYSVPCGGSIPDGASCACNCVEGAYEPDFSFTPSCLINLVCTCIPVSFP